jgi:hypothetical protein
MKARFMPLRKLNLRDVAPFDYGFGESITAQMADIGRAVGSVSIRLAIQTVSPGVLVVATAPASVPGGDPGRHGGWHAALPG